MTYIYKRCDCVFMYLQPAVFIYIYNKKKEYL